MPTAPVSSFSRPTANAWSRPLQPQSQRNRVIVSSGGSVANNTKVDVGTTKPSLGVSRVSSTSNGRSNTSKKMTTDSTNLQNMLRDRFLHLVQSLVGQNVIVTRMDGFVVEGVFHTCTPFSSGNSETRNKYVIKSCKVVKEPENVTKKEIGNTMIISSEMVSQILVKSLRLDLSESDFKTDSDISNTNGKKAREDFDLVAAGSTWTTPETRDALRGSTYANKASVPVSGLRGNIGQWDQFRANEQLFSVRASFDEEMYTTPLDKSQIDARQVERAERLAREIKGTVTTNIHLAEERGQTVQGDYDEEDLYSGVLKEGAVNPSTQAWKSKTVVAKVASETIVKEDVKEEKTKEKTTPYSKPLQPQPRVSPKKNYASVAAANIAPVSRTPKKSIPLKPVKKIVNPTELPPVAPKVEDKTEKEDLPETDKPEEKTETKSEKKVGSKLNANAKEFTFNPSAASFTPSSLTTPSDTASVNSNTPVQYMHPQVQHSGMVPVMNTQFGVATGGIRYQNYYNMGGQPFPYHLPQHMQAPQEEGEPTKDQSQYGVSPGVYYNNPNQQMMHSRGASPHTINGFVPGQQQVMSGPHIPVMPNTYSYRVYAPMHQQQPGVHSQMVQPMPHPSSFYPPNMQSSSSPMYPPYQIEEGDNFRRSGRGNSRVMRRNSRKNGRSTRPYNPSPTVPTSTSSADSSAAGSRESLDKTDGKEKEAFASEDSSAQ